MYVDGLQRETVDSGAGDREDLQYLLLVFAFGATLWML